MSSRGCGAGGGADCGAMPDLDRIEVVVGCAVDEEEEEVEEEDEATGWRDFAAVKRDLGALAASGISERAGREKEKECPRRDQIECLSSMLVSSMSLVGIKDAKRFRRVEAVPCSGCADPRVPLDVDGRKKSIALMSVIEGCQK